MLRASFEDLRAAPLDLDARTESSPLRQAPARQATIDEANEGLLDTELASEDPINAWLSRYLAPTSN